MMADLVELRPGDVLLLHGCCHNPTGGEPSPEEWRELTEFVYARGAVPMIDLAYQGFGDGLEADVAGCATWRRRCRRCCWRRAARRTSGSTATGSAPPSPVGDAEAAEVTPSNLASLNRLNYSFPPDHGAKVVALVLGDPELSADWMAELEACAWACSTLRQGLADALRRETNSDRFDFVATHRGMFSRLGRARSRWRRCARITASTWSATAGSTSRGCRRTGSDGSPRRSPRSA